jgi:hypothetical protein
MVASALVLEGGGQSILGQELVDSVEATVNRSVHNVEIDLRELQILTMTVYAPCPGSEADVLNQSRVYITSTLTMKSWHGG